MPSQHKIVLVYDTETKEAIEVGLNMDFSKWSKATEEPRGRTLRRQVVKRRETMMDIVAKAISDMNALRTEPGEISDILFYSGLRAYLQDRLYAPDPEGAEQDEGIGS